MDDLFDLCDCGGFEDDAVSDLPAQSLPLIGDSAPAFGATTTNGPIHFPGDFAGQWVVFFSHPSDFTPVCTSEFIAFQGISDDLHKMNTRLLGLSVGSIPSHLAWIRAIGEISDVQITFPVIADVDMAIARRYGMISPSASDTSAVRAVFIIDPAGIIRATLYYPAVLGRNMDEIKRVVVALQTADAFAVATPADWVPGCDVLVGAPSTGDALRKLGNRPDWFLTYKKLPESEINAKIYKKNTGRSKK